MSTLTSVLAATDFSALGNNAVRRAALIAAEQGAALKILHVDGAGADHADRAKGRLGWLAREVASLYGVTANTASASGDVADELLRQAAHHDLLVIGDQARSRLKHLFVGRTSDRVIRCATKPVLAVRRSAVSPYGRALVSADFSAGSEAAIRFAARLLPKARLQLSHALRHTGQESAMKEVGVPWHIVEAYRAREVEGATARLRRFAARLGLDANGISFAVARGPAVVPATLRQSELWQADVVVAGKHGGHTLARFLLGSVSRSLLRGCLRDVLIVPGPRGLAAPVDADTAPPAPGRPQAVVAAFQRRSTSAQSITR
jgi:nucleotide-binding universal stress UspA family protein